MRIGNTGRPNTGNIVVCIWYEPAPQDMSTAHEVYIYIVTWILNWERKHWIWGLKTRLLIFLIYSIISLVSIFHPSEQNVSVFFFLHLVPSGYTALKQTKSILEINPYPTAFPYGNGMVLPFYQQQESSTTKTVHKVINKGLKAYV